MNRRRKLLSALKKIDTAWSRSKCKLFSEILCCGGKLPQLGLIEDVKDAAAVPEIYSTDSIENILNQVYDQYSDWSGMFDAHTPLGKKLYKQWEWVTFTWEVNEYEIVEEY